MRLLALKPRTRARFVRPGTGRSAKLGKLVVLASGRTRDGRLSVLEAIVNVGRLPLGVLSVLLVLLGQLAERGENVVQDARGVEGLESGS